MIYKFGENRLSELVKRIAVAVIGIPLFIGMLYLGDWWFTIFVMVISLGTLIEFYNLNTQKEAIAVRAPSIAIGGLLPLVFYYTLTEYSPLTAFLMIASILIATPAIILSFEIFTGRKNASLNFSSAISGIFYVSLPLISMILLRNFSPLAELMPGNNLDFFKLWGYTDFAWLVLLVLSAIWICDSAAYFGGRAFGKHKLFKRVSPKKTWEGAVCGFAGAIVGSYFLGQALLPTHPAYLTIVIGAVAGSFGQLGDLGESLLKRDAGIKDSSNFFPGHGGFLDRFDSVLFVFPLLTATLIISGLLF